LLHRPPVPREARRRECSEFEDPALRRSSPTSMPDRQLKVDDGSLERRPADADGELGSLEGGVGIVQVVRVVAEGEDGESLFECGGDEDGVDLLEDVLTLRRVVFRGRVRRGERLREHDGGGVVDVDLRGEQDQKGKRKTPVFLQWRSVAPERSNGASVG
jgi:hypothetical protein